MLKKIDIFGSLPSLNVVGKTSYQTYFGTLLTVIFLIIILVVTVFFSSDLILRRNPSVISSEVLRSEKILYSLTNQNFYLAWTIEDDNGSKISDSETFMFPHFYVMQYDNVSKEDRIKQIIDVPSKDCDKMFATEAEQKYKHLTRYRCFNFDAVKDKITGYKDVPFFGSTSEDQHIFLYLTFSNCKFNYELGKDEFCLSLPEVEERIKKNHYLIFQIPTNQPDMEDSSFPIKGSSKEFTIFGSHLLKKYYLIDYINMIVEDDVGYIFPDTKAFQGLAFNSVFSEAAMNTEKSYENNNLVYSIQIDIGLSRNEKKYKRVYVKMQEVAANVGGFIKTIYLVFHFFGNKYSEAQMNFEIIKFSRRQAQRSEINSTIARLKNEKENEEHLSFCETLKSLIGCRKSEKLKKFKAEQKELHSKMEVSTILRNIDYTLRLVSSPLDNDVGVNISRLRINN